MKQRANIFYCKLLFDVDAIKQLFHLPQFSLKYFQIIQLSTSHNASSNWLSRFLCDKISCLCLPFPTFLRETKSSRLLTQLLLSQGSTSLQSFFDIFLPYVLYFEGPYVLSQFLLNLSFVDNFFHMCLQIDAR